jgi:hypothetical protein
MKRPKKSYFLARDFDWPVENGPATLGSLIVKPNSLPIHAINSEPFDLPHEPIELEQKNWEDVKNKFWNGSVTLFAEFLLGVIPGPEITASRETTADDVFKCDKLVTKYIDPRKPEGYIQKRMEDLEVQKYLAKNPKRVFMITGLKIAYNPEARHKRSTKNGGKLKVPVDLTAVTVVPMDVGAEVGGSTGGEKSRSYTGGTSIVYAFQLLEIWYDLEKKTVAKTKQSTRGAYMDIDRPHPRHEEEAAESKDGTETEQGELADPEAEDSVDKESRDENARKHESQGNQAGDAETQDSAEGLEPSKVVKLRGVVRGDVTGDSLLLKSKTVEDEVDGEEVECVLPEPEEGFEV